MAKDPHFQKTVLALHFDNIADPFASYAVASSTCESITPAIGTLYAADVGYGTYAGRACASLRTYSSAYYGVYGATTGVFDGDFTLELWFHPVTNIAYNVLGGGIAGTTNTYSSCYAYYTAAGLWYVTVRGSSLPNFTFSPALNEWHHFVITSESGTVAVFIDGVRRTYGTIANNASYNPTSGFRIGYTPSLNATGLDGYASDLRLYKGTVKYPFAGFTPPDWPLPPPTVHYDVAKGGLVSATGSALAVCTADSKFGGGCLRLDGASYLECAASADWQFNTGDFTVEAWVKITADSAPDGSWNKSAGVWLNDPGSGRASMEFLVFGNATRTGQGLLLGLDPGSGWVAVSAAAAISQGAWHHIAVCRAVGTVSFFLDGAYIGGGAFAHSIGRSTNKSRIGGRTGFGAYNYLFNGFIDDVRITKGVARYTEDFTPPAQAFPDGQAVVSGVIYDSEGNLCSRRVFVHSRATGRLLGTALSDPVTGVYEIAAEEECYVVCLDSTGSYNAKVIDGVDPTA